MPSDASAAGRRLVRDLFLTALLAVGLYLLFTVFNRFLPTHQSIAVLLLEAGAVILVAYVGAQAVGGAVTLYTSHPGRLGRGRAIRLFVNLLIGVAATLALFDIAGVSVQTIFLGSAFTAVILGLAAQTVLGNVFAGILIAVSNPFRIGERISVISSQYGAIGPSYPHETIYPTYTGTVQDLGLIYTQIRLGNGKFAKIPNSVLLTALIVKWGADLLAVHRVRMTFPHTLRVADIEASLTECAPSIQPPRPGVPPPRFEVADIAKDTWDGVVEYWSAEPDENRARDVVLRALLPCLHARLPEASPDVFEKKDEGGPGAGKPEGAPESSKPSGPRPTGAA